MHDHVPLLWGGYPQDKRHLKTPSCVKGHNKKQGSLFPDRFVRLSFAMDNGSSAPGISSGPPAADPPAADPPAHGSDRIKQLESSYITLLERRIAELQHIVDASAKEVLQTPRF